MTASFILNGFTTDLPTLQTGLLGLTGLPGVDAETVKIAQRFYAFITINEATEANPFHDPRALQQEILRRARTDPAVLKVFMMALSLQTGWKSPASANRFAEHVDLSFLKGRSGPEQLSAGAVVPERSGSPVLKVSRQNGMQAAQGTGEMAQKTIDDAVHEFIDAGHFKVTRPEDFGRALHEALSSKSGLIENLQVITAELAVRGQNVGIRIRIHLLFQELGVTDFRLEHGLIIPSKGTSEVIATAQRYQTNKTAIESHLREFVSTWSLESEGLSVDDVVAEMLKAVESGAILEGEIQNIGGIAARALKGSQLERQDYKLIKKLLNCAGYDAKIEGTDRIRIRLKEAGTPADAPSPVPARARGVEIDQESMGRMVQRLETVPVEQRVRYLNNPSPQTFVATRYDKQLRTNLYFTVGPSTEVVNGVPADVPKDAKVIVIWFHGTGSDQAYGGNFWAEMNALLKYRIASVGFDYPFFGRGPQDVRMHDINVFMEWVHNIVSRYRLGHPDKRIILAGHSYGPAVLLEYLSRYPNGADGAVVFSPAGRFSREMAEYFRNHVIGFVEQRYQEDSIAHNTEGELWDRAIAANWGFLGRRAPNIPIWAIAGQNDQWFPPDISRALNPLVSHFPSMRLTVVPGMDHFPFHHLVQEMPAAVTRDIFSDQPGGKKMRFVAWSIIDFLRSRMGLKAEIPTNEDPVEFRNLPAIQKAALLYEVNPVFRQVVFEIATDASALNNPETAQAVLELWERARVQLSLRILANLKIEHPDFYDLHSEEVESVLTQVRANKGVISGKLLERVIILTQKLDRFGSAAQKKRLDADLTFTRKAEGPDGSEGRSYWSRSSLEDLLDAFCEYSGIRPEAMIKDVEAVRPRISLISMARTAMDSLVRRFRSFGGDPIFSETEDKGIRRRRYLEGIRDTINIPARNVLSIGAKGEVMIPFGIFDGTDRVVVLAPAGFGSPANTKRFMTPDYLKRAHLRSAEGTESDVGDIGGAGGDYIAHLFMGMGVRRIINIYYFQLSADGRKFYISRDPERSDSGLFANAEIRFRGPDGRVRYLEVIKADEFNLSDAVRAYLRGVGFGAVYAGTDATDFEVKPQKLLPYYSIVRDRGIPFVTGVRRTGYWRGIMPAHEPFAFLNADGVELYDIGEQVQRHRMSFHGSSKVFVARAKDFSPAWRESATWRHLQNWYENMARDARDNMGPGVVPFEPANNPLIFLDAAQGESGSE